MDRRKLTERGVRISAFLLSLVPLGLLIRDALLGRLGANPVEELTHRTGWWTLTFLALTLTVTPARRLIGWGPLIKLRRMLGLFAFFYASLHFIVYLVIDQFFAVDFILEDIGERPYITVGLTAFVLLIPLAVTSTKRMIRRIGGRRWNLLHSLVYVSAGLGVLHFLWLVKADTREPTIFATVLVVLLGYRLVAERVRRSRLARASRAVAAPKRQARRELRERAGAPSAG
jgi:sulfoxide reductase heme-binding subunit YedZ